MTALSAAIARLQGLAGWRRNLFAGLLGALTAASHAPLYLWPVALAGFVILFLLAETEQRGWRCFLTFYAFAYAYFVAGLYWKPVFAKISFTSTINVTRLRR